MKITIKNFQKKIVVRPAAIKKAVNAALSAQGLNRSIGSINLCFVGDSLIRKLNSKYLCHDRTTDVLAFDLGRAPKEGILADIVISVDTANRNARKFCVSLSHELCLYAVHGILHLCGYDDKTAAQRKRMNKRADSILKRIILFERGAKPRVEN